MLGPDDYFVLVRARVAHVDPVSRSSDRRLEVSIKPEGCYVSMDEGLAGFPEGSTPDCGARRCRPADLPGWGVLFEDFAKGRLRSGGSKLRLSGSSSVILIARIHWLGTDPDRVQLTRCLEGDCHGRLWIFGLTPSEYSSDGKPGVGLGRSTFLGAELIMPFFGQLTWVTIRRSVWMPRIGRSGREP